MLEYNPTPPFQAGSPQTAEEHILQKAKELSQLMFDLRVGIIRQVLGESLG
ncbi:MAG: hypothetical protein V4714_12635 [Bacteroidota bacterium]